MMKMNAQEVQQESYAKRVKKFLYTTLNAMTFGIFGTIVVGAIIQTLGTILGLAGILPEVNVLNGRVAPILTSLLGMGIGLSIGLSLKLTGLKLVMISVAGGISTLLKVDFSLPGWFNANTPTNNPITAYFVVISVYFVIEAIFRKKTVYDLFFIPVVGVLAAVLACYVFSWPIEQLMELIYATIRFFMNIEPYTTSAFVALIFGILLTLPFISSAGVAAVIFTLPFSNNDPIAIIAMCAAVVGCTAQMVGFSIQTIRKNDIGTIFTIGLASSMFQFKNVMKKPMTWVPTLIASFVLAPLCYVIFDGYQWFIDGAITNDSPQLWPGMGSSGLVGQLLTLSTANFSGTAWLFVGAQIVFPALLVFGLDVLFIKMKWYSEDDLILDTTL
jgi:uncharacterized membrane protein